MRYQIWNKTDPLCTPVPFTSNKPNHPWEGRQVWQPDEYIAAHAQWAGLPGAKAVITTGVINCGVFDEFNNLVNVRIMQGLELDEALINAWQAGTLTPSQDNAILAAIEDFEDNPPGAGEPSEEAATAAAMEFANLLQMPNVNDEEDLNDI